MHPVCHLTLTAVRLDDFFGKSQFGVLALCDGLRTQVPFVRHSSVTK